ncbi:MAG: lysoplasmalogenase [Chloroflexota bacterium]|nr:MAG: lysoplasmalogenase [Chloroflexota bacterium]
MAEQAETQRQRIEFGILSIIFTGMALLSASGAITAEFLEVEGLIFILKPVTMALIILVAFLSYDTPSAVYKWAIIIGLILSLAGDIMLMLPADLFLNGLISFALAHLVYTTAFINSGGFYGNWKSAIPFLLFGVFMAVVLWPNLDDMLIPAMVYLVIILLMAWQGYGQWRQTRETRSWLAFIGVLLFIASDSLLAVNRWVYELDLAPLLILGTYYPAQWLIGQSAGRKHR